MELFFDIHFESMMKNAKKNHTKLILLTLFRSHLDLYQMSLESMTQIFT